MAKLSATIDVTLNMDDAVKALMEIRDRCEAIARDRSQEEGRRLLACDIYATAGIALGRYEVAEERAARIRAARGHMKPSQAKPDATTAPPDDPRKVNFREWF